MLDKIKNIIQSRFIDGDKLPDWYQKRLDICGGCEFNSANVGQKSITRKAYELIAKDHCISCSCTISQGAKVETKECPKGKWPAELKLPTGMILIKSKTDKGEFTYDSASNQYIMEYKYTYYDFDSRFTIFVPEQELTEISLKSSCGCTVPTPRQVEGGLEVDIKYDTKRVGAFNQFVALIYNKGEQRYQTRIAIKGKVIR